MELIYPCCIICTAIQKSVSCKDPNSVYLFLTPFCNTLLKVPFLRKWT